MTTRYASPARSVSLAFLASVLVAIPFWAWADTGRPPDVVRLKNGGMVRGTILEAIPGEAVRVQMSDGNVREFAADTVDYAGPDSSPETAPRQESSAQPAAPPSSIATTAASVVADKVRVRLVSPDRAATFGISAGTSSWAGTGVTGTGVGPTIMAGSSSHFVDLCTAPCEVDLQRGTHEFILTLPDGRAASSDRVVIPSAGQLHADYVSRRGTRVAGWITLIGGSLVGSLLAFQERETCDGFGSFDYCETEHPTMVPGLILLGASLLGGTLMALTPDRLDTSFAAAP